jgi:hypothetical protein
MLQVSKLISKILNYPRIPILWVVRLYQHTISPDHGVFKHRFPYGYCRFHPTCSEYGYQVIKKRGLLVGIPLSIWRILRCNPWSKGGIDLP